VRRLSGDRPVHRRKLRVQLMRTHPEGISSVVLDSVVPPQNNLLTHLWGSAAGGFKAAFDACVAQPRCAGAYPDLENEFTTTVQRLAKNPMTVDVPGVRRFAGPASRPRRLQVRQPGGAEEHGFELFCRPTPDDPRHGGG
jgi:hypothetical protein